MKKGDSSMHVLMLIVRLLRRARRHCQIQSRFFAGARPVRLGRYAQPSVISEAIEETIPEAVIYDRRAANGKSGFYAGWLHI